jgi:putrescine transport system ATP-binding protein
VAEIAYRGDFSVYKVRLDSGFVMKASVANASPLMDRALRCDDRVTFTFAPAAGVLLTR